MKRTNLVLADPNHIKTFVIASENLAAWPEERLYDPLLNRLLIAAIAIENDATIWQLDRDFAAISTYTALRSTQRI